MFKSSFSKYLLAFVSIILLSFLMLSGIVTSMIRSYSMDEKEHKLSSASTFIASQIEAIKIDDMGKFVDSQAAKYLITSMIYLDSDVDIIILDESGMVFLTTIHAENSENKEPIVGSALGKIDVNRLSPVEAEGETFTYMGTLGGYLKEKSLAYCTRVDYDGATKGYVFAVSSTLVEDNLIGTARRAVVNSSVWVMLAAVIAAYFITERLVNPLRNMTKAVREFARGELSTRVVVSGKDEVAELGDAFNHMAESLQNLEKMRKTA